MTKFITFLSIIFFLLGFTSCNINQDEAETTTNPKRPIEQSGAGLSLDFWAFIRAYPSGQLQANKYEKAFHKQKEIAQGRTSEANWTGLGPKNIGGRTLCLAFHPNDNNTIYAGSASGGLWKTTTSGEGYVGWENVPTGFPVLGVSSIAINPNDPNEMYIGTGEVYNNQSTMPGVVNRLTRGSYGIGILKTTDGGTTWEKSLDWDYSDLTGVSEVTFSPDNPNIVFAATSEGLYRSQDAGQNWSLQLDEAMTYHIAINPNNPARILVTVGAYLNENTGIYVSDNGGETFTLAGNGAPFGYTGKARIKFHPTETNVIYCSASDALSVGNFGLYKSEDGGDNWTQVSNENIPTYQGWYAHDVAIDPQDANTIIWVGVDLFKSNNSGANLEQKSYWYNWDFGQTPVGGPEGPGDYVHADIHAVYWHPNIPNKVFAATDGGIFVSDDNGENWTGRNGSYQTTQFYANFSSSDTNVNRGIGGMQDNSTAIYLGSDSWKRVIGGDGGSAAYHPQNDNILYGTSQYLGLRRSNNGGDNFSFIAPGQVDNEYTCFIAPIELDKNNPNTIYAAGQKIYRSENSGNFWQSTSVNFLNGSNPIITFALSNSDEVIFASTVANPFINNPLPSTLLRSNNGGVSWTQMQGLPDRVCTDIAIHPTDSDIAFCTFSGFGTAHLYKTIDAGVNWEAITEGLPDIPTNSVAFDPEYPEVIYVANDLGVYSSENAHTENVSFSPFTTGLPEAVLAVHLDVQDSERKIRVATHGSGIWESDMLLPLSSTDELREEIITLEVFPNPARDFVNISFETRSTGQANLRLISTNGQVILNQKWNVENIGIQQYHIDLPNVPAGNYIVLIEQGNYRFGGKINVQ